MADLKMAKGSCLCGSVSYQFQIAENVFDVCHCSLCRKWTGGPGFGVTAIGALQFNAERAFCKKE